MQAIRAEAQRWEAETGRSVTVSAPVARWPYEDGYLVLVRGRHGQISGYAMAYVMPGDAWRIAAFSSFNVLPTDQPVASDFMYFRTADGSSRLAVWGRRNSLRVVQVRISVFTAGEDQEVVLPAGNGFFLHVFEVDGRTDGLTVRGLDAQGNVVAP